MQFVQFEIYAYCHNVPNLGSYSSNYDGPAELELGRMERNIR